MKNFIIGIGGTGAKCLEHLLHCCSAGLGRDNLWSVRDADAEEFKDGNPVEFKTLNLTKIIKILNSVANDEFQPTLIASLALNFNLLK